MSFAPRHFCWLLSLAIGCQSCFGDALARLESSQGDVERDFAATVGKWLAAEAGAKFAIGDGLRTHADGAAVLALRGGGKLQVESDTTIRFRPSEESTLSVDVEEGEAQVEAGEEDIALNTEFGLAVVTAQSGVRVKGRGKGRSIEVAFGAARVPDKDGTVHVVGQGQSIEVGFGAAQIVDDSPDPDPEPEPEPEPEVEGVSARVSGAGVEQRAAGEADWQPLPEGEATLAGDSDLRLPSGTRVTLQRPEGSVTLEGSGQFHVGGASGNFGRSSAGALTVDATEGDVVIQVPGGRIVARGADGGTRARLSIDGETTAVDVAKGMVTAVHGGEEIDLGAGERAVLGADDAESEASDGPRGGASRDPADGVDHGIDHAEVVVTAGQNASVYDPKPPTAVGFALAAACPDGGQVRIGKKRAAGKGQANLSLARGLHQYRIHCNDGEGYAARPKARGRIRVVRSAGTRTLPKRAPKNHVDLDGRRYTLLFSNRKPSVAVGWPTAPASGPYTLSVTLPGGGTRKIKLQRPKHTFPPGELAEGETVVSMSAGGASSRETRIAVRFDNAAPTASLSAPPPAGFAPGKVPLRGVVLPGSRVSVDGNEIALDSQQRFSTELPVPSGRRAIAIRIEHPRTGVRYYLRRAKSP